MRCWARVLAADILTYSLEELVPLMMLTLLVSMKLYRLATPLWACIYMTQLVIQPRATHGFQQQSSAVGLHDLLPSHRHHGRNAIKECQRSNMCSLSKVGLLRVGHTTFVLLDLQYRPSFIRQSCYCPVKCADMLEHCKHCAVQVCWVCHGDAWSKTIGADRWDQTGTWQHMLFMNGIAGMIIHHAFNAKLCPCTELIRKQ